MKEIEIRISEYSLDKRYWNIISNKIRAFLIFIKLTGIIAVLNINHLGYFINLNKKIWKIYLISLWVKLINRK
jgi:hypothetical protein